MRSHLDTVGRGLAGVTLAVAVSLVLTVSARADTVLNLPGDQTVEATGLDGAQVTYSATAEDGDGNPVDVNCDPASGSTFQLGTTTVHCSANEASGSFDVTVHDTTGPVISGVSDLTAEASSAAGATVTFSPTATDVVDGAVAVNCDPASGSTFALGPTSVTCSATDATGNSSVGSFAVTVVDTTPPVLQGVPAPAPTEATGPAGSQVSFTTPTASDAVDPGPLAVSCAPPSGSTFGLGTTTVTCSAQDAHANTGSASFSVAVVDTTPPHLRLPDPLTVSATGPDGATKTDDRIAAFLDAATATDIVDPHPVVTNDAPASFPVGVTSVQFVARDAAGNKSSSSRDVTVLASTSPTQPPPPPPAPKPPPPITPKRDSTPPGDVTNLVAKAGDRVVTLSWSAPDDADFDHVTVFRSTTGTAGRAIYSGTRESFRDRRLKNAVRYQYVVVAYDAAGNRPAGVAVSASPHRLLLTSPANGARVIAPPLLTWRPWPKAAFYNVQLFRGQKKVLSAWPKKTQFRLSRIWTFRGVRQKLTKGTYTWYVWPAFGSRRKPEYGGVLGSSTFVVSS